MLIMVQKIQPISPQTIERPPEYWIEFSCQIASGHAILYSRAVPDELCSGELIGVEIEYKTIEGFCVLIDYFQAEPQLRPLVKPGDYEVIGQVMIVTKFENEEILIGVGIGVGWFMLTLDEIGTYKVSEGDWVRFKVIGLTFWDEHL